MKIVICVVCGEFFEVEDTDDNLSLLITCEDCKRKEKDLNPADEWNSHSPGGR